MSKFRKHIPAWLGHSERQRLPLDSAWLHDPAICKVIGGLIASRALTGKAPGLRETVRQWGALAFQNEHMISGYRNDVAHPEQVSQVAEYRGVAEAASFPSYILYECKIFCLPYQAGRGTWVSAECPNRMLMQN